MLEMTSNIGLKQLMAGGHLYLCASPDPASIIADTAAAAGEVVNTAGVN